MNVLSQIIENKKIEIENQKKEMPLSCFITRIKKGKIFNAKKIFPKNRINIIGEIKRKSPLTGIISKNYNLIKIAKIYDKYCSVISILTDQKFFGGRLEHLRDVNRFTKSLVLRKDFIIDKYQIYQSRFYEANLILLIASILDINKIKQFFKIAKKYNMLCIVEVHTSEDLNKALKAETEIIGINNRDLNSFKVNINTTIKLSRKIPKDKIVIAESGIKNKIDIDLLKNHVDGFLIGTSILKSKNIEEKIKQLIF